MRFLVYETKKNSIVVLRLFLFCFYHVALILRLIFNQAEINFISDPQSLYVDSKKCCSHQFLFDNKLFLNRIFLVTNIPKMADSVSSYWTKCTPTQELYRNKVNILQKNYPVQQHLLTNGVFVEKPTTSVASKSKSYHLYSDKEILTDHTVCDIRFYKPSKKRINATELTFFSS